MLATSADTFLGDWHGVAAAGLYQRFSSEGTCATAITRESLGTKPDVRCTYQFEADRLNITEVEASALPPCTAKTAVYRVQLLANGNIKFLKVRDVCRGRAESTAMEHEPFR